MKKKIYQLISAIYVELILMLAAALCGIIILILSNTEYFINEYILDFRLVLLNTLPIMLFIVFLYGIFGKAWYAYSIGSGLILILSLCNYYKLSFRNDPLIFEDIFILREAVNMSESYMLFLDEKIVYCTIILTVISVGFYITRGKRANLNRRMFIVSMVVILCFFLVPIYRNDALYYSFNNEFWAPTQAYQSHGFMYPFIYSMFANRDTPSAGYSEKQARELLSEFTDTEIPENRKVNIFVVMREAYVDFSQYEIEGLDCSDYELYHQLREESYHGNLFVNIFAGGTVDTERGFLTGNYYIKNFRKKTNSYVWYMKNQGYTVEGSHPYYQWFYNRENVNPYLGFENYLFYENCYCSMTDSHYPEDKFLYSKIYSNYVNSKESGKPYFSFNVNVQSHGPYDITQNNGKKEYLIGERYTDDCKFAMNNYMNVIMDSDRELINFIQKLQKEEEPIILLLFSDHLPWMGDDMSFYDEMGMHFLQDTDEANKMQYMTEYLIWANDAAKRSLNNKLVGEGPTVSPCYLMNILFEQCSWEGPAFMQAMNEIREVMPVVSTQNRFVVDGKFCREIPEERQEFYSRFLNLQYYWRNNFMYNK